MGGEGVSETPSRRGCPCRISMTILVLQYWPIDCFTEFGIAIDDNMCYGISMTIFGTWPCGCALGSAFFVRLEEVSLTSIYVCVAWRVSSDLKKSLEETVAMTLTSENWLGYACARAHTHTQACTHTACLPMHLMCTNAATCQLIEKDASDRMDPNPSTLNPEPCTRASEALDKKDKTTFSRTESVQKACEQVKDVSVITEFCQVSNPDCLLLHSSPYSQAPKP
jgi:hypothetical protein